MVIVKTNDGIWLNPNPAVIPPDGSIVTKSLFNNIVPRGMNIMVKDNIVSLIEVPTTDSAIFSAFDFFDANVDKWIFVGTKFNMTVTII